MGAWGSGCFENDTALDWAGDVASAEDVRKPFEQLKRETDGHMGPGELVLDPDFASGQAGFYTGMKSARKVDDTTVRITTAEPDGVLPARMYWLKMRAGSTPNFSRTPVASRIFWALR